MKLLPVSDLHLEFHRDGGKSLCAELAKTPTDVVMLAGDIITQHCVNSLKNLCGAFGDTPILYICGNHEFYGADDRNTVLTLLESFQEDHPNFFWLENDIKVIGGQRFLGTPLWFRKTPATMELAKHWSDFSACRDFAYWVYEENAKAIKFLEDNLQEGDVVMTHHLPSMSCVSKRWQGHATNCFFVCEIDELIAQRKPKLWHSGHSHDPEDRIWFNTHMIRNPFGYANYMLNPDFRSDLVIDI